MNDFQSEVEEIEAVEEDEENEEPPVQRFELLSLCRKLKMFALQSKSSDRSSLILHANKIENILFNYQPNLIQTTISFPFLD